MSSSNPPAGPPSDPQGPEYLEQGGGQPLPPESSTGSRPTALIGGGAIAALALIGGGVWAATSFLGSGPQPAEALPGATLGYASIDLDPSGSQKVEAVQMLRKFPAFKEEIGLDTDDDVREKIFEEIRREETCSNLDYEDDIGNWLGNRFAVAAVDTGEEMPSPVLVIQVTDEEQAEDGLAMIRNCATSGDADDDSAAGEGEGDLGWSITGGWAVVAETEDIATKVTDAAADGTLADDEDYQRWTDEVGDAGIVNMYAGPEAGEFLATEFEDLFFPFGVSEGMAMESETAQPSAYTDTPKGDMPEPELPEGLQQALEDFQGAAATIRFDNGALEFEIAGDAALAEQGGVYGTDAGDDVLATLPEDTAAAFGVGFEEGWFAKMLDGMAAYSGGSSPEDLIAEMEAQTGLSLPEDVETMLGESAALSMGADFDPEAMFNSESGLSELPIGLKVKGEPDEIEAVLEKIRAQEMGSDELAVLDSDGEGDVVAIGPNSDYRESLLDEGDLGESDTFQNVVREAEDASAVLFVNFDAGDDWLVNVAGDDQEAAENLEPLEGLGMSTWTEDDASHAVLRLTTN